MLAADVVAKCGNPFFAQGSDAEIQGNAHSEHPNRLRQQKRCEHEPIGAVRKAAQKQHAGDAERVDQHGERAADNEFCGGVSDQFPRRERAKRGDQRAQAPQPDIPRGARKHVGDQAADVQGGDAFRIKERQHGQRFGGADLKSERAERKRAERAGQSDVQGGNDARPAQHLGCELFHDSVTSVVFR